MNRSRFEFAVLKFTSINEKFTIVDDLQTPEPIPTFAEAQSAAGRKNPELRAAMAALNQARQDVAVAWNRFLPSLSFDYFYGIDANQFAIRAPNGDRNLGYAATASLQLPVWNWGANRSKVKQANLRRPQANMALTETQRELPD